MTTEREVLEAMQLARSAAVAVLNAAKEKLEEVESNPLLFAYLPRAKDVVELATQNVATVTNLRGVFRTAVRSSDPGEALAQAMVVVEQTEAGTLEYARFVEDATLANFAREVWEALKNLLADFTYEVFETVLVVGKRAADSSGFAVVVGALLFGGGLFVWARSRR